MSGKLTLCATPIGNLEDITLRVLRTLKEADLIAAEDTRNSRGLLTHFDIHTDLTSYHEHNKYDKARTLIEKLKEGKNIALISDAGMPGISDPGEVLVKMAIEEGIEVTVLPGASASLCALVLSGLSCRRFVFEGFLPADKKERKERLEVLGREERTILIYEAPHRLVETLEELGAALGEVRKAAVVRELTKKHETVHRGTISELIAYMKENAPRGECVIVIEGRDPALGRQEKIESWAGLTVAEHVALYENEGCDKMEAMKKAAKDRGVSKRDIYRELLNDSK